MANWVNSLAKKLRITLPTITPAPSNVKPQEIWRKEAFYWQQFLLDQPIAYLDICHRIQFYLGRSSFLRAYMGLKLATWHSGFRILAENPAEQQQLDDWMRVDVKPVFAELFLEDMGTSEKIQVEANQSNGERMYKFCRDAFQKFLEYDTVVGLWLDDRDYCILRPLEYFLYSDIMGIETMKYMHGLSQPQIETLPAEQQQRYISHPLVFINPKYGEHWKLAKRTPVGEGFGIPWIMTAFMILGEEESKEIGLHGMSWFNRTVARVHKLGHQIESGPLAGRPQYEWNKDKSDAMLNTWKDVTGVFDVTENYDVVREFPWPDVDKFDCKMWESSRARLNALFGPLASLLASKGNEVNPHLGELIKAEAHFDRHEHMDPFFTYILEKAYKPPVKVKLYWSDDVFSTTQLLQELRKFMTLQGVVSPQTMQEWGGLIPELEAVRKLKAVKDKDAQEKFMPIYDSAHGTSPALDGATPPKDPNAVGAGAGTKPGTPAGGKHKS